MKRKTLIFTLSLILSILLVILLKYSVIEDIIGLFISIFLAVFIISNLIYVIFQHKWRYKKLFKNSILVFLILQIFLSLLILWSVYPRYFLKDQLLNDIDYTIRKVESVHPDMYEYISKEEFNSFVDSTINIIDNKIHETEALQIIAKILDKIQDGHTTISYKNVMKRGAFIFRKTMPYKVKVINNKLYVIDNFRLFKKIPIGSRIIEINNIPSKKYLKNLDDIISNENLSHRNKWIEDPYYWGIINQYKNFTITYIHNETNETKTICSSGGIRSVMETLSGKGVYDKMYDFKVLEGNIGYIEFNQSLGYNRFKLFLEETFKKIHKNNISDLIIDIRRNSGGSNSLGEELLKYISHTDFKNADSLCVKISDELIRTERFYKKYNKGELITQKGRNIKIKKEGQRYKGNSYLLVGGYTYSAAVDLTAAFSCYNMGTIFGQETGGVGICTGNYKEIILPNTGIIVNVSTKKFYQVCGTNGRRGYMPDIFVDNSIADYKKGIDRVIEYTKKHILEKR